MGSGPPHDTRSSRRMKFPRMGPVPARALRTMGSIGVLLLFRMRDTAKKRGQRPRHLAFLWNSGLDSNRP